MPSANHKKLTAPEVEALHRAPRPEKPRKVFDERGLFLEVPKSGSLRWRFRYYVAGSEKLLSLGTYPDVSLKDARDRRDEMRQQHANGVDPSTARKAQQASEHGTDGFEAITREWYAKKYPARADKDYDAVLGRFDKWVFPYLGAERPDDIDAPTLLKVVRRIEDAGKVETAHRTLRMCGQVFRYAIVTGRATKDPTPAMKGALAPVEVEHHPAITDPDALGQLLRAMD